VTLEHRLLLYIETSVFGFCFDTEPRNAIRRESALALLEQLRLGVLNGGTSPVTFHEFENAAEPLRSRLLGLLDDVPILPADDDEVERLAEVYLHEGIVPGKFADDARHIAYATAGKADVLVSLNLRHLANEWTERKVEVVNQREGYKALHIRTPEEVLSYEG
jgi:hypothetical protein